MKELRLLPLVLLFLTTPLAISTGVAKSLIRPDLQEDADGYHAERQQPNEGISLGEVIGHQRIYASAGNMKLDGPKVDERTLYEIGSISKVFTGILLADTVLQGKAALKDSIGKHLPEGVLSEDSPLHAVTLLQLTTHTSGLPRLPSDMRVGAKLGEPYAHYTQDRLISYLKNFKEEDFEKPGEYSCSNLGVGLLGEILAIINDTDYATLLQDRILDPLDMDSTWVQVDERSEPEALKHRFATGHRAGNTNPYWKLNVFAGGGAIVSSVEDMLSFAEAHWSESTPAYLQEAFDLAMQPHS